MARTSKKPTKSAPVEAVVHKKDKRVNIPTRELADFVVKEEQIAQAQSDDEGTSQDAGKGGGHFSQAPVTFILTF